MGSHRNMTVMLLQACLYFAAVPCCPSQAKDPETLLTQIHNVPQVLPEPLDGHFGMFAPFDTGSR